MMTGRQYLGALAVLVASGLLGGGLSNWLLHGRIAGAPGEGMAKEVRAERFVVVDEAGNMRAALGVADSGSKLALCDAAGSTRVVLGSADIKDHQTGATTKHPISTMTLLGETGHVLWQAP